MCQVGSHFNLLAGFRKDSVRAKKKVKSFMFEISTHEKCLWCLSVWIFDTESIALAFFKVTKVLGCIQVLRPNVKLDGSIDKRDKLTSYIVMRRFSYFLTTFFLYNFCIFILHSIFAYLLLHRHIPYYYFLWFKSSLLLLRNPASIRLSMKK